jgi:hypothetical protein
MIQFRMIESLARSVRPTKQSSLGPPRAITTPKGVEVSDQPQLGRDRCARFSVTEAGLVALEAETRAVRHVAARARWVLTDAGRAALYTHNDDS